MEPRLNVFYSYSQGSFEDIREEKTLEDNVTRALIVTLNSSPVLTSHFLHKFLGTPESVGEYHYGLQAKWEGFSSDLPIAKGLRRRQKGFILGVAPDKISNEPENRKLNELADMLQKKLVLTGKDEKGTQTIRKSLNDAGRECSENGGISSGLRERLKDYLGQEIMQWLLDEKSAAENLRYLYELLGGSRPDAIVHDTLNNITVIIENKIHGSIVPVQIVRHIRENFGKQFSPEWPDSSDKGLSTKDKIPVLICSWRKDIYPFFKGVLSAPEYQKDAKVNFLIEQLVEYLEETGMGEIEFKIEHFLEWEKYTDLDYVHNLRDRVERMGEDLATYIGNHGVMPEHTSHNYLGVNIFHNDFIKGEKKPVEVPHWSLALVQQGASPHCLVLYITCVGKKLTEVITRNSRVPDKLARALNKDSRIKGNPRIQLNVLEKIFLRRGGKGKFENLYTTYACFPFELCKNERDIKEIIDQAFKAMRQLNDHKTRESRIKEWPDYTSSSKNRSVSGVLQLSYHLNWLELERSGVNLEKRLEDIVELFKPFYEVLIESS
jgi:hypothetical protein